MKFDGVESVISWLNGVHCGCVEASYEDWDDLAEWCEDKSGELQDAERHRKWQEQLKENEKR
jgi:hypothetical protein